jgi:UDP-3-O-[3-hydroxymyristoyl] glucosamine N-acyltransferase
MNRTFTAKQLAEIVGGLVRGDTDVVISGVAEVSEARSDQATWVSNPKYARRLVDSRAGVVLVPEAFGDTPMPAILCRHIARSVAKLLEAFAEPLCKPQPGIHPTASVHETARIGSKPAIGPYAVVDADVLIGASCVIHAGVYIGRGTTIGDDCVLWPNVVIRERCVLGSRVMIHPNAVIGADGFGFYFDEGRHQKVPHTGGVILEDDVEIGACSCVDRAKFGYTVVGQGTKIDNLVQVGHNVRVGKHCVMAALTGIAGSVRIGDYCVFGGKSGVADNVTLADRAQVAAGSIVHKDLPEGVAVSGCPARPLMEDRRERGWTRRLPALAEQLKELTKRVEQLEVSDHHRP